MSPGVITPCTNAIDAVCENKPDRCLAGCFNSATNPYFAKFTPRKGPRSEFRPDGAKHAI